MFQTVIKRDVEEIYIIIHQHQHCLGRRGPGLIMAKIVVCYDVSFLCTPPCWGYFLKLTPGFSIKFTVTPLEFSISCTPWESMFFAQFLMCPPGIPTTYNLPPRIFHWYPQQDVFFWKRNSERQKNYHQYRYKFSFLFWSLWWQIKILCDHVYILL